VADMLSFKQFFIPFSVNIFLFLFFYFISLFLFVTNHEVQAFTDL